MKRLVVMTVGKTHSGKTTFARILEQQLPNSLVIDHDNHAEFINTYYRPLLPKQGQNTIKYAITKTIVDFAVEQTNFHLIICNSNRSREDRMDVITYFHNKGFTSILVNFNISDHILMNRVVNSRRSTTIFRSTSTFKEVLARQHLEDQKEDVVAPTENEADHFFEIQNPDQVLPVTKRIVELAQHL